MLTHISSAISNPAETASTLSSKLYDNCPNFSKNITESYYYSTLSTKLNDELSKYPALSSTLNNGTTLIYSLPTSIGDKVYSYTSMFEPVNSEEREITRTHPNENLGENVIPVKDEREEIVNYVLDLYSLQPTEECFKYYSDDVIYNDPITYTTGLQNLKAQFYGMQKLFVKSTIVSYKILENTPNALKIDLNQRYTLPFVNRAVVQNIKIIMEFDEEKKISKHINCWYGEPAGEGGIFRKGFARFISTIVKVPN